MDALSLKLGNIFTMSYGLFTTVSYNYLSVHIASCRVHLTKSLICRYLVLSLHTLWFPSNFWKLSKSTYLTSSSVCNSYLIFSYKMNYEKPTLSKLADDDILQILKLEITPVTATVPLADANDNENCTSSGEGARSRGPFIAVLKTFIDILFFVGAVPYRIKYDTKKELYSLYRSKPQQVRDL